MIVTGAGATKKIDAGSNNYRGVYEPVVVPDLSATIDATNGSDTGWYLWVTGAPIAAFVVAYLNGVETPVIEEVALSGEILGRAWRGYMDVGVAQWDKQGAVNSAGQ